LIIPGKKQVIEVSTEVGIKFLELAGYSYEVGEDIFSFQAIHSSGSELMTFFFLCG
jgi:hypothetical protein